MATESETPASAADGPPLAKQIFTQEQLTEHARLLAVGHRVGDRPGPNALLARLDDNERVLRAYNRATYAVDQARRITPASEWILDNFYLIEEQIQMAQRHLPRRYSRELPKLSGGRSDGLPRVYDLVLGYVTQVDGQLDMEAISAFLKAYQVVTPLKLGELWAVPIMIRLALIENLRRITDSLSVGRRDRDTADEWAHRLETTSENQPSQVVLVVADMARGDIAMTSSFVAEFCQRLARSPAPTPLARSWLEQRLAEQHQTIEQLVRADSQRQASDQVSTSNTVSGLRMLGSWDWRSFVEAESLVERELQADPADVYRQMDFATRDAYRHAVEEIARSASVAESDAAEAAVQLAEAAARSAGREDRSAHVGYYLVGRGRRALEAAVHSRLSLRRRIESAVHSRPSWFYMGGIVLISVVGAALVEARGNSLGIPYWKLVAFAPLLLLSFSQLAVAVVNWAAALVTGPRLLPRLDYSGGIPPESRTMVVIPTLVPDVPAAEHLLESIEIHYLANRDPNLHFALLTDFVDADSETLPGDEAVRASLRSGIEELNSRYNSKSGSLFFLFHRPRRWSSSQRCWMGYERKRGKIAEFNAALRGEADGAFSDVIGDSTVFPSVRYVITLDSDTQLPRGAARLLAATISHPLNRPRFSPKTGTVVEGYGILQPRVAVSLPGASRSWYSRLFAGDAGIDPYTKGVSDVYQDVFEEGSFIGKGIYDVDTFERASGGRFPENTILSHDLLESCYARSALVTDVELYEDYPSRYNIDSRRRHRWVRGDWQIAGWLMRRVPGGLAAAGPNPLSALAQWKILDNLRRSLVPLSLLVLLVGSWVCLPGLAGSATLLVLCIIAAPAVLASAYSVTRKPRELPLSIHVQSLASSGGRQFGQIILSVVFLPYEAYICCDAIIRTMVRMNLTRRNLLEWVASGQDSRSSEYGLGQFYTLMWPAPAVGVLVAAGLAVREPWALAFSMPLAAIWILAPAVAWGVSRTIETQPERLDENQVYFLRAAARKTWHYFEAFVGAADNWLPPDNFQEQPVERLATRTSPTNMGLSLLCNLAARDFGYLSVGALLERTEKSTATMERLERYKGHFYNWYDTRTCSVLNPRYVSSVDSGNMIGHVFTLTAGLRELKGAELISARVLEGLSDTCGVLVNTLDGRNPAVDRACSLLARRVPRSLEDRFDLLQKVSAAAAAVGTVSPPEAAKWAGILARSSASEIEDVLLLAPWLSGENRAVGLAKWPGRNPTLGMLAGESNDLPGAEKSRERLAYIETLCGRLEAFTRAEFGFLYEPSRRHFATGFNVVSQKRDGSYYDLLASEARLTSYVAVAEGEVPQEHWFALGRLLVSGFGEPTLASWSGSMFEYLMPLLVMPDYGNTLIGESCRGAVERQIEYGRLRGVPWGISESCYNLTDAHLNYQYRAFGVPGLGLKRGLAEDLVIAPYASMLALLVAPREACENLERLSAEDRTGQYGFYEAVDYTPSRVPVGQSGATVLSYMVHHQGMGFLALASELLGRPMQRRFMECPLLKSADLLLQERVPHAAAKILSKELEVQEARKLLERDSESVMRVFSEPTSQPPEVHLLSNGRYHLVVSQAGGGYSRWKNFAISRWREDPTRDCWGTFIYLRDTETNEFWSAAPQPVMRPVRRQEIIFSQGRAEFRQVHLGLNVHVEISVSPEDDVELRRVTLSNPGHSRRSIEMTAYFEVVLAPAAEEAAHPAFANLFVQTERLEAKSAVLCTRRARSATESPPWLFAALPGPSGDESAASCDTERDKFIGRGGSVASPLAMRRPGPLSNSSGSVLDPAVAMRRTLWVPAGGEIQVCFVVGIAETRAAAEGLLGKHSSPRTSARTLEMAWTHSQVLLRQINATEAQAQLYARLASPLIYAQSARRANPSALSASRGSQSGLWRYGISGDLPIALLEISDAAHMEFVQQMVRAHAYWRLKGLVADLVILNGDDSSYRQPLHEEIVALVTAGTEAPTLGNSGGIFVLRIDLLSPADRALIQASSRVVVQAGAGSIEEQLGHGSVRVPVPPALRPLRAPGREPASPAISRDLIHRNGLGGFTRDGREYVISLLAGQSTPAPWANVIANPWFGTVLSESGSAYTWATNSHEYRLTPWNNDPVSDPSGEAIYIRDEETGAFWSPSPQPVPGATPYTIRHGFGYSVFEHAEQGLLTELTVYVAMDAPVKLSSCRIRNLSSRPRRISVTGYCEWVLGDLRSRTLLHVQTEVDPETGALLARNRFHSDFPQMIAFMDADPSQSVSGDRMEFLGRCGSPARPAALQRAKLSGRTGPGLDPAGALQVLVEIPPGQEREVVVRVGAAASLEEVRSLVKRFRSSGAAKSALERVWSYWGRTLGIVNVDTPDSAVNVLVNGWLPYQTLCCRLWARSGFYQSGGAYGFRDQLQDVMALVHAEPGLVREHLLRAAGRQYPEGDVQHWWHPPSGRGVRTRTSDDFLWLPYAACRYSESTGDIGVWDEIIPFIEGRALRDDEESYYDLPTASQQRATLYEHSVRAVRHGLRLGAHGLPLMGSGDWNDGMNLVGIHGKGESVWLAFFLCDVLRKFAPLAASRGDAEFAETCRSSERDIRAAAEATSWDGAWYLRAFFDDGSRLGSASNPECQIDSIPQSWSVLSGGHSERSGKAMESVLARLVRPKSGIIQLFDPPFDKSTLNPGYIKGYIPGVRENGGQYTHAAIWAVMAFAERGEADRAWELFQMLNPVRHGGDPVSMSTYMVEPYVVAADVYSLPRQPGRGGWTWYTGSAGWMYRLLVESLIGIKISGGGLLCIEPRLPRSWDSMKVHYRHHSSLYHISLVRRVGDPSGAVLDGSPVDPAALPLRDDGAEHWATIPFG